MGLRSLVKGKVFERMAARLLGEAVCGDPKAFIRMPLAGRLLEGFKGDILSNPSTDLSELIRKDAEEFLKVFLLDAKDRKGWTLENMVASEKCEVWDWWEKLSRAAAAMGRHPFLILKYASKVWGLWADRTSEMLMKGPICRMRIDGPGRVELFPWEEMQHLDRSRLKAFLRHPRSDPAANGPDWEAVMGLGWPPGPSDGRSAPDEDSRGASPVNHSA